MNSMVPFLIGWNSFGMDQQELHGTWNYSFQIHWGDFWILDTLKSRIDASTNGDSPMPVGSGWRWPIGGTYTLWFGKIACWNTLLNGFALLKWRMPRYADQQHERSGAGKHVSNLLSRVHDVNWVSCINCRPSCLSGACLYLPTTHGWHRSGKITGCSPVHGCKGAPIVRPLSRFYSIHQCSSSVLPYSARWYHRA